MKKRVSHLFDLQVQSWSEVHEIPQDWSKSKLAGLLELLGLEDVDDADQLDMVLMGLQEREVDEAADLVLKYVFGSEMRSGIRANLIHELEDDRPWEEFAEMRFQHGIFSAVTLLQRAFPKQYGKPDIARVELSIAAKDPEGQSWLSGDIDAALLLRLLAKGMNDRALLRRLFSEALESESFPDADSILWTIERTSPADADRVELTLHASLQWLESLEEANDWTAEGWPDAPQRDTHPQRSGA